MITVYKYKIDPELYPIDMPKGAQVLSVKFQGDELFLWAKIDTKAKTEKRQFKVFGTGRQMPIDMGIDCIFIGTAHTEDGLVFHVFEWLKF